jgi:hypothetical protein
LFRHQGRRLYRDREITHCPKISRVTYINPLNLIMLCIHFQDIQEQNWLIGIIYKFRNSLKTISLDEALLHSESYSVNKLLNFLALI